MNRTGLFIAGSLAVSIGIVFGIFPELDLKLAALFYDPHTRSFPLKLDGWPQFARDAAMWIVWLMVAPAIIALVVKALRPDKPLLVSGRAIIFLLLTLAVSSGGLANLTFKSHWGRPRPIVVTQLNTGQFPPLDFVSWWDPRGKCGWNCSFSACTGGIRCSGGRGTRSGKPRSSAATPGSYGLSPEPIVFMQRRSCK